MTIRQEDTYRPPRRVERRIPPTGFRPDIEGLRAVAVFAVVLYHAGIPGAAGGYIGVDVFFVISGFLITRQLSDELASRGRIGFADFYARRFRRIVPAAALVVVVTVLACWRWLSPLRMPTLTVDAVFAAVSGINWRLAADGTDYFRASAPPSPFQHYWSLSVEEVFRRERPVSEGGELAGGYVVV